MEQKQIRNIVQIILVLTGVVFLFWWLNNDPTDEFTESLPGLDNQGKGDTIVENIIIGEHFKLFSSEYKKLNETWPRFRGSEFDNISKSPVKLKEKFGAEGPDILWSLDLGEGHSGAAIYKGLVYLLDYDEANRADMLRCFSLTDGVELWRRWYNVSVKRNHGMSRTVPAVTDKYIVTIGPRSHVMCVERENGNFKWGIDVEKDYHSEVPFWYTGQCPLIDNGKAIIATGGDALMIAVDCETGEIAWKTPNPKEWKMSHSSIMPFEFGGRRMYVYSAIGGLCGIAADGPDAGTVLWEAPAWTHSVIAPSPVCMPDGRIFLTAGYGAGSMVVQLSENNGVFSVEVLDEYSPRQGLACEQQTPVYLSGHLFGIMPKDGGALRNQLVCVSPSDTKKIIWSSGKEARFGLGPYFIADNKFFILSDDAVLTIIRPSTKKYIPIEQVKIIEDAHDAWAPLAIADGYLVLRDSKRMVCIDMRL
ncbi:MAG: PQQ-binding-like beta-propeller repeat protein [Chlorobi bacterium]|nr:PQQ-binding-like beta-propeller repeat protein [Chlorobiota bacterium]